MPLPTPANTTCQIYRAGTSPGAAWNDPCADANGTDITAHAPTIPPSGVYLYCLDNIGGVAVESNTLQGTDDGGENRFYFDPGLPDASSASIDFKYTNSGASPVDSAGYSGYYLRLGVRYGNDAAGGDGFLAHLIFGGATWVLTLYQFSSGVTGFMNSVNLTLSPDTWYTLNAGTDGAGNVFAAVVGQGSTSAPTGGAYSANTQVMFSTDAGDEMAFRNIVASAGASAGGTTPCILSSDWRPGQQHGDRRVNALAWTDVMLVDAAIDVRDGYTGANNFSAQDTVYIPDANGTPFTVVFVELCGRGPAQFKRVFLDRGLPIWPILATSRKR
jgi:hypothetical protein